MQIIFRILIHLEYFDESMESVHSNSWNDKNITTISVRTNKSKYNKYVYNNLYKEEVNVLLLCNNEYTIDVSRVKNLTNKTNE